MPNTPDQPDAPNTSDAADPPDVPDALDGHDRHEASKPRRFLRRRSQPTARPRYRSTALAALVVLPLGVITAVAVDAAHRDDHASGTGPGTQHFGTTGHFLLAAAVILTAAFAGGRLAQRLGQPPVIGEICAGIALGPSLLGHTAPDAATWLFPEAARQLLDGVAQFGLIIFMFGVGRELAETNFRGATTQALLVSQASLLVPFAVGAAAATRLDEFAGPHGDPLAFVMFMGCALSITAFPVLARILIELGITRTAAGRLSLFAAALGDGGSWLLLAAILAYAHGSGPTGPLLTVLGAIVLALVFLGPLRAWLRRWTRTAGAHPPAGIAPVLVVAIAATSALTAALGIHQLIGAVLVGLVWPSSDAGAAAAADQLTATAASVLLPFFFFGFGLTIDLTELQWDARTLLILGALLLLAAAAKIAGPGLCGRLTGMPWKAAATVGVLLNARGLTELVVIQIGYQAGIIDQRMSGILTLVALVTTIMTAPLLHVLGVRGEPSPGPKFPHQAGPATSRTHQVP